MTNATRLFSALPLLVTLIFGLAACGGGGGGSSSSSSGGGSASVPRPQCSAPAALALSSSRYGFLFPSEDASSGKITLINADNFNDTSTPSSLASAQNGSAVIAQSGVFMHGPPAEIDNLRPRYLVYVSGGDVYRKDLQAAANSTPLRLTTNLGIGDICTAKIVTGDINTASQDYYLYSTPSPGNTCQDSAQDDAHLLPIVNPNSGTPPTVDTVDNANPVEVLGSGSTGKLLAFVAIDKNGDLSFYDSSYTKKGSIEPLGADSVVSDIYHALNLAYIRVNPGTRNDQLIRVEAMGDGQVAPARFSPNSSGGGQVTASSADDNNLYYAVKTDSDYRIFKVRLNNPSPDPTRVTSGGSAGTAVISLTVTDTRLVFLDTTGTLYAVDKSKSAGQQQKLDTDVVLSVPVFSAKNRLYYTVVSGGNLEAKIVQDDGNGIADYKKSAWFGSTLPIKRPVNGSEPDHILLAAGYTGSPNTLAGSILDSFATDSSTSCTTFNHGVGAQPVVIQRFNSVGTGRVGSVTGPRFAFDASDGRFVQIP